MTFGSQNISPKVDFRKSKIITGSRLPEVKNHHRKSTPGSQKSSPEVDSRKSKNITESRLPEVKKHYGSRLLYIKKIIYFILFNFLKYVYKIIKHLNFKKVTLKKIINKKITK